MNPPRVYLNEWEPFAAKWLRNLAPEAFVDERSIADVQPDDVRGYQRAHFFAGIGGWELALAYAGWPEGLPVWTGSCPCQPFSIAGEGKGEEDPRHLWPEFRRLIGECLPPVVFGEQVAAKAGREWLSRVRSDLEALGYVVGAADLCAASTGAPHIRQRLFFGAVHQDALGLADADGAGRGELRRPLAIRAEHPAAQHAGHAGRLADAESHGHQRPRTGAERPGRGEPRDSGAALGAPPCGLGDANGTRRPWGGGSGVSDERAADDATPRSPFAGLGDADGRGRPLRRLEEHAGVVRASGPEPDGPVTRPGYRLGLEWASARLIYCGDDKVRRIPTEPRLFPLAHGVPNRVGRLRAYGNAIVPQVAAQFIGSMMEVLGIPPEFGDAP